ncbi:MAG: hypothetical protein QXT70_01380 [Thermofilaceae archaeon]
MQEDWLSLYEKLRAGKGADTTDLLEKLKERFVAQVAGHDLEKMRAWILELEAAVEAACKALGARGVVYPKEFKSFIEEPEAHLRKKLFIYAHDLVRGRLSPEEFREKASAAVKTSILTNGRSLYQSWVYVVLVYHLAKNGYRLIYPDDLYLHLERTGRQRTGGIPPNAVLSDGVKALSLFIEAPRPVGWEDSKDLSRAWKLYTALRPDILAYGGRVLNIVTLGEEPPVLRPDVIIECKELDDWYKRARELKGPIAAPLSAEEWRERWISGLYIGLADVLNVRLSDVISRLKERKGLRLRDPQIVLLYKRFYEPKRMFLVSRAVVPADVKRMLEDEGVELVEGVGFSKECLAPVAEALEEVSATEVFRADFVELTPRAKELLKIAIERMAGGELAPPQLVEQALEEYVLRLRGAEQPEQD